MVIALTANDFVRKGEAVVEAFHEGNELRQVRRACLSLMQPAGGWCVWDSCSIAQHMQPFQTLSTHNKPKINPISVILVLSIAQADEKMQDLV